MASNDFKNSLKLLLTNIKDKHYTKEETNVKLQEIVDNMPQSDAIVDVEELLTENANENVLYRTFDSDNNISKLFNIKNGKAQELQNKLIAKTGIEINDKTNEISSYAIRKASEVEKVTSGGWQGTVVPTSGTIESVYFNTELSIDEVVATLNKLTDVQTNEAGTISAYTLLKTNSNSQTIVFMRNKGVYYLSDNLMKVVYFDSTNGWGTFDNPIAINLEATSGDYTGTQNDLLTSLFSLTPFEHIEETTEYIGNEKCIYGGGKSPVPNTGYVDKVYFNTDLSVDEVRSYLEQVAVEPYYMYVLVMNTDMTKGIACVYDDGAWIIMAMLGETSLFLWSDAEDMLGWNPNITYPLELNCEVLNQSTSLPPEVLGTQNDKLVDLFYMGGGSDNLFYLQNKQKKIIATKEDLSIQDVKELPKDKKEKVAIPTSGIVDTVYFNTDLSIDEVVALIDKLSVKEYYVFVNEESIQSGDLMAIMIDKSSYSIYCSVDGVSNKIFTQSSGWDTSFPNSATFNLQNDMTVMRHELQNDILVELMYCIKIEKEKINENVLYRVEENSGWQGTTIPDNGMVEKIYFNRNLSYDEVTDILKSLRFVDTPFTSDPVYPIVLFSGGLCFFVVDESDSKYAIYGTTDITNPSLATVVFSNFTFDDKMGWHLIVDYIDTNANVVSEYSGLPIGSQNDKLSSLFSTTPFVKIEGKPQLYHFKDRVPYQVGLTKEDVIDIINEQFENAEEGAY